MRTLHMSTTNSTKRARLSADVRWQPVAAPADPRYVGDVEAYLKEMSKAGAWKADEDVADASREEDATSVAAEAEAQPLGRAKERVTIEQLRARWGLPVAAVAPAADLEAAAAAT